MRVEDEGVVIVADLPKKVTWDQDRLAVMAERIRAAGDDPTEYLEIAYRVSERRLVCRSGNPGAFRPRTVPAASM